MKIIIAHIYLDHIATATLRAILPQADIYLQGHRPFLEKLTLCQSLGCFAGEFGKVLAGINAIRNRFAHQLAFDVSDETKKNLFRLLTKSRPISTVTMPGGFDEFLMTVVVYAEAERAGFIRKADIDRERVRLMEEAFALLSKKEVGKEP